MEVRRRLGVIIVEVNHVLTPLISSAPPSVLITLGFALSIPSVSNYGLIIRTCWNTFSALLPHCLCLRLCLTFSAFYCHDAGLKVGLESKPCSVNGKLNVTLIRAKTTGTGSVRPARWCSSLSSIEFSTLIGREVSFKQQLRLEKSEGLKL